MSRSEPKPKIIYRTLQDIVSSNLQTKLRLQQRTRQHTAQRKCSKEDDLRKSLHNSSSKHSLKQKQKLITTETYQEYSFNKQDNIKIASAAAINTQTTLIYSSLQQSLNLSKFKLGKFIKQEKNEQAIALKLKELQNIHNHIKKFIFCINLEQSTTLDKNSTEGSILKQSLKENMMLEQLSVLNQKNKVKSRLRQEADHKNHKKPSVYQNIISKRF